MNKINNSFKIIASFAPLSVNNKSNKSKIVSSIFRYTKDIDFTKVIKFSSFIGKNTSFFNKNKYLIINIDTFIKMEPEIIHNTDNLKVLNLNTYYLLNLLGNHIHSLKKKILTSPNVKADLDLNHFIKILILNRFMKDNIDYKNNLSHYNVIFIFNNITWSNIVYMFYIKNIIVYGGSGSRRHLLSTVQSNLVRFISLLDNFNINNSMIHESFTTESSSNAYIDRFINNIINDEIISKNFFNKEKPSNNQDYILILNLIFKFYNKLVDLMDEKISSLSKIDAINKDILQDKKRFIKYSKMHDKWGEKKLININKKTESNKAALKTTNILIEKLSVDIKYFTDCLYKLDNNNFDKDGICNLNHDIIHYDLQNKNNISNDNPPL